MYSVSGYVSGYLNHMTDPNRLYAVFNTYIDYHHTDQRHYINIQILPTSLAYEAKLINKHNDVTDNCSHCVIFSELSNNLDGSQKMNGGDMTRMILRYAKENKLLPRSKSDLSPEDFYDFLVIITKEMIENSLCPEYLGTVSEDTEASQGEYKPTATKEQILNDLQREHMKLHSSFTPSSSNNPKSHVGVDRSEVIKNIKDTLLKALGKDAVVKMQEINSPEELKALLHDIAVNQKDEKTEDSNSNNNNSELTDLMEKYSPEQLKALIKPNTMDDIRKKYPTESVEAFEKYINKKSRVKKNDTNTG